MCKKAKNKKINISRGRDVNIFKCAQGELNLGTRTIRDKTKYSRKEKHKNKGE
jgi:hypothetical protein